MSDLNVQERHSVQLPITEAACLQPDEVLDHLGSSPAGLTNKEAAERLAELGPNAVRTHRANGWAVLGRQFASPILILLIITAALSLFLGDATNSIVIGVILLVSVGLGFTNEFRAERASEALHSRVTHRAIVLRDGTTQEVNVTALVPGDVVHLSLGAIVPADIRLLSTKSLLCDESILTGESLPAGKDPAPVAPGSSLGDLASCVFMGTVIQSGGCTGVVVATGGRAEFGRIALGLGERQPQTEFQLGLKRFSFLLLQVAIGLTTLIFIANLLLHRPLIESLLFSLAIAVGITPQLLPAVVSTSLATGTRQLARRKVLVKRLVCIEDLGDMDILVTDKTGTLTEGRISFTGALPVSPEQSGADLLTLGLLATETDYSEAKQSTAGQNPLDAALWECAGAAAFDPAHFERLDLIDFDHQRRRTSVLVREASGSARLVTKGAPEDVLALCGPTSPNVQAMLDEQFDAGSRVVAVATRPATGLSRITPADEVDLVLAGFLVFLDRPKANAKASLEQLARLGISVKIATGDNAKVAEKVCSELGVISGGTLTGADVDALSDTELASTAREATIFARVSPEQKARIVTLLRQSGGAVGFMGDGVNDALALHKADIGISVDSATDVAKDAADIVLLEKDLGVLAEGVMEGRRIFANTIKYVLMGTSSNFGNMFSAATASVVLSFLPMLPGQILLNNLLYDSGQLAIPGDRVDKEQLLAPSHWNIAFIRRFMFLFGPISSIFDFATFALMLFVFNAVPGEFRAGWFIESIATQTLIIFAIRTRRVPFLRSRPSVGLLSASLGVVAAGIFLPLSPLAGLLGFDPLPVPFFLSLLGMIVVYMVLVEFAKQWFFARAAQQLPEVPTPVRRRNDHNGFSHQGPGLIDTVLSLSGTVTRVYLPPDANTLLVTAEHVLRSKDYVNLVVVDKQPHPQYLTLEEARRHAATGASIWPWAGNEEPAGARAVPDVVMACAGDIPTQETLAAAWLLREHLPDLVVRVVNVMDAMVLPPRDTHPHGLSGEKFAELFTADGEVIMAWHGYARALHQLLHGRPRPERFHVRGYNEQGTTTTPFDMVVLNKMSRYRLVLEALRCVHRQVPGADELADFCLRQLEAHARYIREHFEDLPEIRDWVWTPHLP